MGQGFAQGHLVAGEFAVVVYAEQHVGGFAPVGDEDGAVVGGFLASLACWLNWRLVRVVMVMRAPRA